MATVYEQLPAPLDLALVRGDEFRITAAFAIDLTGYTLSGAVVNADTQAVLATPTLTLTVATANNVTTSSVLIVLTETQTAALSTTTKTRWYLRWVSPGGVTRTVLAGQLKVANP
jgi:hypothetical protein